MNKEKTNISDVETNTPEVDESIDESENSQENDTPNIEEDNITLSKKDFNELKKFQRIAEKQSKESREQKSESKPSNNIDEERIAELLQTKMEKFYNDMENKKSDEYRVRSLVDKASEEFGIKDSNIINQLYKSLSDEDIQNIKSLSADKKMLYVKNIALSEKFNDFKVNDEFNKTNGIFTQQGTALLNKDYSANYLTAKEKAKLAKETSAKDYLAKQKASYGFKTK